MGAPGRGGRISARRRADTEPLAGFFRAPVSGIFLPGSAWRAAAMPRRMRLDERVGTRVGCTDHGASGPRLQELLQELDAGDGQELSIHAGLRAMLE